MIHDTEHGRLGAQSQEHPRTELSRRTFLKGVGAMAGIAAAGMVPAFVAALSGTAIAEEGLGGDLAATLETGHGGTAAYYAAINGPMRYPGRPVYYADSAGSESFAMMIDVKACIGCRRCVYACVKENNIGRNAGYTYIQVVEMKRGSLELKHGRLDYEMAGDPERWYMPVQCKQCAKPTCVLGCPVKATWKEPDGIVLTDYKKCIGCKNCLITCPYEARHVNWVHPHIDEADVNPKVPFEDKAGVIDKCTFCVHRTRNGGTTACTEACPVGARTFGDLNDPDSAVSQILKKKHVFRLKEKLGNEPMIWFVG